MADSKLYEQDSWNLNYGGKMKITAEQLVTFGKIPVETYPESKYQLVDECRQISGYSPDPDWECPHATYDSLYLRDKYPDKDVGGFMCVPCLVKESNDWQKRELLLPILQDHPCINNDTP